RTALRGRSSRRAGAGAARAGCPARCRRGRRRRPSWAESAGPRGARDRSHHGSPEILTAFAGGAPARPRRSSHRSQKIAAHQGPYQPGRAHANDSGREISRSTKAPARTVWSAYPNPPPTAPRAIGQTQYWRPKPGAKTRITRKRSRLARTSSVFRSKTRAATTAATNNAIGTHSGTPRSSRASVPYWYVRPRYRRTRSRTCLHETAYGPSDARKTMYGATTGAQPRKPGRRRKRGGWSAVTCLTRSDRDNDAAALKSRPFSERTM